MAEKECGQRRVENERVERKGTGLLADTSEKQPAPWRTDAGKAEELDRHLTTLGFPDGRPLWDLHPERIQQLPRNCDERLKDRKDIVGKFNDELWELTHSTNERFVPTLEPDARDWSPFVIKSNYHAWARRVAGEYGLEDHPASQEGEQSQDLNAFRHAATAAVFAIKYGPKTALLLGTINELITESGAVVQGHMNESEIADCNADLLNNRAGINVARKLLGNSGEKGQLTLKEVTDEVVRELRNGALITKPIENLRNENIAPELKLLLGKPDGL